MAYKLFKIEMPTHLISCMGLEELLAIKMLCAKGDKKKKVF